MDAAEVMRRVAYFEVFQDPVDALPLAECDFYLLIRALIKHSVLEEYCEINDAFRERLDALHSLDVTAITSDEFQTVARYAALRCRCDLLEPWVERRGEGPELLNAVARVIGNYPTAFLTLLPRLLDRGELTATAARRLLIHPETWPYLVGYIRHPFFDVSSVYSAVDFWQFFIDAHGPHIAADPRILYRELATFGVGADHIPLFWSVYDEGEREHVLKYQGELGTIREMFDLRQIRGLPGLPPAPFENRLFLGQTYVPRLSAAELALVREDPGLEEHVGFCQMREANDAPPIAKYLSWLVPGMLSDRDRELLRKLETPQPRRALQYLALAIDNAYHAPRARRESLAVVRARCLALLG